MENVFDWPPSADEVIFYKDALDHMEYQVIVGRTAWYVKDMTPEQRDMRDKAVFERYMQAACDLRDVYRRCYAGKKVRKTWPVVKAKKAAGPT